MTKHDSKWDKVQSIGKILLAMVIIVIAVRMAIGIVILILTVAGFTMDWLQSGAPIDSLRLRPRDFIIPAIVLTIYCLSRLNRQKDG